MACNPGVSFRCNRLGTAPISSSSVGSVCGGMGGGRDREERSAVRKRNAFLERKSTARRCKLPGTSLAAKFVAVFTRERRGPSTCREIVFSEVERIAPHGSHLSVFALSCNLAHVREKLFCVF